MVMMVGAMFAFNASAIRDAVTETDRPGSSSELTTHAIAVLPFESQDPGAQDRSLAAGLTESVRQALADNSRIALVAHGSSIVLSDHESDFREMGRRLNARFLVEGGLQRMGPRIRLHATLVDATSDQTVWTLDFERPEADLPTARDEIASHLSQVLGATVNASADEWRRTATTSSPDAYLEYLQACALANSYRLSDLQQAVSHYARALEIDPSFSGALSGLAWTRYQKLEFRSSNSTEKDWTYAQMEARQELQKALTLDNRNVDAWLALAAFEDDPDRADAYVHRAVAIEPNSARTQFALSQIILSRAYESAPARMGDAIALMQNAMRLDPLEPRYPLALAEIYNFQLAAEIDKAEPLMKRALEVNPNYFPALYALGALRYCCQNRIADGIRLAEQALRIDPTSSAVRGLLVHMYLNIGDLRAAERLLARDNENLSAWLPVYAYRHEWHKAAAIMYDDTTRANLPIPPDDRYGHFAVLMSASDPASLRPARELFEKEAKIRWQDDGRPVASVPIHEDMSVEVGLADLMMRAGDQVRARRVLEMVLAASETAAANFHAGTIWFTLQRARAFALLGRTEEALRELSAFSRSGWAPDAWMVEADTAFDGLRGDERFKRVIAERQANALRTRAEVDALRSRKVIPEDLRWR